MATPSMAMLGLLFFIFGGTVASEWPLHILSRESLTPNQSGTTDLYAYDLQTQNATLLYNFIGDEAKNAIAATSGLRSSTLCYATSTGIQCHQNRNPLPELTMAFGLLPSKDQEEIPFHMQLSPDGSQLMYLEPQRGGVWVHSLKTNTGILVHLQSRRISDFSCDWFNGMLFILQIHSSGSASLSAWSLNGGKMATEAWNKPIRIDGQGSSGSVTCDPVQRRVYWVTSSEVVYSAPYDKNDQEQGQKVIGRLCKSIRERRTQVPLIYNNNTLHCVSEDSNKSLVFVKFDPERPAETPIFSLPVALPTSSGQSEDVKVESFESFNIGMFQDWSHVPDFTDFVQRCSKCSHLCLPRTSPVDYVCACPLGLELIDGAECTSSYRLALALETEVPRESQILLYDYAKNGSKTWLQSGTSNLPFVPSDEPQLLCFRNGTRLIECSDLETKENFSIPWTQDSDAQAVHLVSRKFKLGGASSEPTQWLVYWTDAAGCSRQFSSSKNTSYAFYCFPEMDNSTIAIDPRNWQLVYTHKLDSSINLVDVFGLKSRRLANQTSAFKDSPNRNLIIPGLAQAYYFEDLSVLGITDFAGESAKYHLGFQGTHHSLAYGGNSRLWWVESNTVYSLDLESKAGIEVVMKVPQGTRITGLRHVKVQPQNSSHTTDAEIPKDACAKSQCTEFCQVDEKGGASCWCPYEVPLELNSTHCQPFRFLMVLNDQNNNSTTVNVSTDDTKEVPVDISLKIPDGATFLDYNAGLQRSCWLEKSGKVTCSGRGHREIRTEIKTSATKIIPVVPSLANDDQILWLSIEQSGTESLACFTMVSPQRARLLRSTCVQTANVEVQFPVLDVLNRVLFWYVADQGVYATFWQDTVSKRMIPLETPVRGLAVSNDSERLFVLTDTVIHSYSCQVILVSKKVNAERKNTWYLGDAHLRTSGLRLFKRYLVYNVVDILNRSSIQAFGPVDKPPEGPFTMYTASKGTSIQSFHVDLESPDPSDFYKDCRPLNCDFFCFPKESEQKAKCLCPGPGKPMAGKNYSDCSGLNPWWIIAPVIFALIVIIAGINVYVWIVLKNRQNRSLQAAVTSFMEGNSTRAQSAKNDAEMALYVPFTAIIPLGELATDYSKLLGEGNFGTVCQGKYRDQTVAVKTVKNNLDAQLTTDFLKELKIMAYVGDHPNIVKFHGAEISGIRQGKVQVVLELCPQGCLETYLRSYDGAKCVTFKFGNQETLFSSVMTYCNVESRPSSQPVGGGGGILRSPTKDGAGNSSGNYINGGSSAKEFAPIKQFYRWSHQIADAMDFLESKNVIHGDLATRNVLMFDDDVVKVSDFGFSRNMYSYSTYSKKSTCPLPWRWASPETLCRLEFSFKADVWSYGVTLWEIFTFGNVPYPDQNWDLEFANKIQQGMKLPQPKFMGREMYEEILLACWELEPGKRIGFRDLKEKLSKYI